MPTRPRHVVLVGLMASGKTTVGTALAARMGRPFVDNDSQLAARTGRTAREIADAEGAGRLHVLEAEALVDALASPVPAVAAAAAGAVLEPVAVAALQSDAVVYLRASPAVLEARLTRGTAPDDHRPFVADDPRRVLEAQFAERDDAYRALATLTVDADGDAPGAIVDEITSVLARSASQTPPGS
jgi:shikimate kinase